MSGGLLTPPISPALKEEDDFLLSERAKSKAMSLYQSYSPVLNRIFHQMLAAALTIQSYLPNTPRKQNTRLRRTAYLDGLRGFAAVLVYILHHECWAHDALHGEALLENGYGFEGRYFFAQMPFIRNFFTGGHFSVAVFFVISGYVLSAKSMSFIHNKNYTKLHDTIASAVFRRWLRLYLPIVATTFVWMTLAFWIKDLETGIHPGENYFSEIYRWYDEFKQYSFSFRTGGVPWMVHNFHTWTIPFEFKGSMIIYTSLLAFSRLTRNSRLLLSGFLMFYYMYIVDCWYGSCFVAGMLLVDLDYLEEKEQLPSFFYKFRPYKTSIFYTFLVVSLYLGGVPSYGTEIDNIRDTPGWYYLSLLRPSATFQPKSFYLFWAAFLLVPTVPRLSWLKTFFEHPINQFFGRISFCLYLVHGPILWSIGDRVYAAVGLAKILDAYNVMSWAGVFWLPSWGPLGLEFNFLCAQFFLFPFTLWIAKITTDLVDEPSIRFAQWTYDRVCAKDDEAEKFPA